MFVSGIQLRCMIYIVYTVIDLVKRYLTGNDAFSKMQTIIPIQYLYFYLDQLGLITKNSIQHSEVRYVTHF